jgi:hypothetical protein
MKERDHFENTGTDERIILKSIVKKQYWRAYNIFIWPKAGKISWLLRTRK